MTAPVAFSNSGLAACPKPLGACSSRLAACPFAGVGGLFGKAVGSLACQGVEPSQIPSAAFLPSDHIALPGAQGRFLEAI